MSEIDEFTRSVLISEGFRRADALDGEGLHYTADLIRRLIALIEGPPAIEPMNPYREPEPCPSQ